MARARIDTLESDLGKWEAAVAARDVELQNLQRALGANWEGQGVESSGPICLLACCPSQQ